jgi:cytochrome c
MTREIFAAVLLASLPSAAPAAAQASEQQLAAQGKAILEDKCSRCHQIGTSGRSPLGEAPPFRMLMQRYKPEQLEEALGEGLSSGHPAMPEFVFEPYEISAIVAYLGTLRQKQ